MRKLTICMKYRFQNDLDLVDGYNGYTRTCTELYGTETGENKQTGREKEGQIMKIMKNTQNESPYTQPEENRRVS